MGGDDTGELVPPEPRPNQWLDEVITAARLLFEAREAYALGDRKTSEEILERFDAFNRSRLTQHPNSRDSDPPDQKESRAPNIRP